MKFGFRIPSFKKRIAARTSWKRFVRHSLGFKVPRGFGWFTNPRKALYNRIYNRTTFDIFKLLRRAFSGGKQSAHSSSSLLSLSISALIWLLLIGLGVAVIGFIFSPRSGNAKAGSEPVPVATVPAFTPPSKTRFQPTITPGPISKTELPAKPTLRAEGDSPALLKPEQVKQRFVTSLEAQKAAIRLHPDLGVAGSKLNTAFVARYKIYQKQNPEFFNDTSWPMRLAEEIVSSSVPRPPSSTVIAPGNKNAKQAESNPTKFLK